MLEYIKLLRPQQYIKNVFLFLPLLFSENIMQIGLLTNSFLAFLIFCFSASSVYIINDIRDVEQDRMHPHKKDRPIASGAVPVGQALFISVSLMLGGIITSFLLHTAFGVIMTTYLVMNLAYSFGLKRVTILDVTIIAIGFVLRVLAGAAVVEIVASMWIVLMTFLLALFLALGKRRDDLLLSRDGLETRRNIDGYSLRFVNLAMTIMATVVIVCYIMYTISYEVQSRVDSEHLYLSSVFVILGILRYMQRTFVENNSGNPTMALYQDRFIQVCIILWLISLALVYYV